MAEGQYTIVDPTGKQYTVTLPTDTPLRNILPLISTEASMEANFAVYSSRSAAQPLDETQSLDDQGLGSGSTLYLREQAAAPLGAELDQQLPPDSRKQGPFAAIPRWVWTVLILVIAGGYVFFSRADSDNAADNMKNWLDSSFNSQNAEAADLTCSEYSDEVRNNSVPNQLVRQMETEIEVDTGIVFINDEATADLTMDITYGGVIGTEGQTTTLEDSFTMKQEDGEWKVCDEKFANGLWGYVNERLDG